ncbi:cyclase family protein [Paenibacillus pini]|uniref:Metal-dependent hydrolase n=1 Tax=Paenibacillus pini JCM 16418 TaxID=1236976 RepID=W7YP05_9BACL|nr:cyclase family protein [Paenibacillus pini]GAF09333.1 metal-dependent hydrolase [Paenibacillus pini JCM 16418]
MNSSQVIADFMNCYKQLQVYDVSPVFETNMPGFHNHPSLGIVENHRNFCHHGYYAQTLIISEHTGSHVDAPGHCHGEKATIDQLPVDCLIGPYKKYDLSSFSPQAGKPVELTLIKEVEKRDDISIQTGDIILIDFGWDKYYKSDSCNYKEREWWGKNEPGLTQEVCKYFVDSGIKAIGADTPGVDICMLDGNIISAPGHVEYFLPNNILIMEGFSGMNQAPAAGIFIALPLKIKNGSGSPIRPILLG